MRNKKLLKEINFNKIFDPKIKSKLENLCQEFSDIFALEEDVLSVNNFYKQNILLNDSSPMYIKNYRTPESKKTEINEQVNKLLSDGIVQHSISPYNNPLLLVPKKSSADKK